MRLMAVSHLIPVPPFTKIRLKVAYIIFHSNLPGVNELTHWGRVTHICVGKQTIIGSDNGLSPGRRQAIIWTNAGILLIGPLGTNFSEISINILTFSFTKMRLKVSSAKWRPFCLGLNVLSEYEDLLLVSIISSFFLASQLSWFTLAIRSFPMRQISGPWDYITKTHVRGFFDTDLHEVNWHFATHEAVRTSGFEVQLTEWRLVSKKPFKMGFCFYPTLKK